MRTYAPRTPEKEQAIVKEALRRINYVWSNNIALTSATSVFASARQSWRLGNKAEAMRLAVVAVGHTNKVRSGGHYDSFPEPEQSQEMWEQAQESMRIERNIEDWLAWTHDASRLYN